MVGRVLFCLVTAMGALGCHAGFRSSAGSANSPDGLADGVTNTIVIGDEGGPLSRLALGTLGAGLGAAGAMGGVSNVQMSSDTSTRTEGDTTITTDTTTTSGTYDADKGAAGAAAGMAVIDHADRGSLSSTGGGLAANLEIASRSLGGDTSGAQFDLGYAFRRYRRGDSQVMGLRGYVGLGYGKFTMHQRAVAIDDRGPPMFADGTYKFFGIPARLGLFVLRKPSRFRGTRDLLSVVGTESFLEANLNSSGSQRFAIGQRVQLSAAFFELEVSMRDFDPAARSYTLELGLGI
jgi:hypothetical protein